MSEIQIRRAYDTPGKGEGKRVLVDRLWPRGLSHDRLNEDLWLKDIAPSDGLRHWFDHDPAKWDEFCLRYGAELDANPAPVQQLRDLSAQGPLTLIFAARDPKHNNAAALRDYLSK